ncbi:MAG TPA: DUF3098 domain-containing protein [Bacteroidales bacterium]|nr:DUF3098 domain-containing protein [Bacteroidales bacterium]HOE04273.1 DUF3098 domain-containing protein [Bacteroidales bacterium]HQL70115.1 DUF3098 domain-containing protein [Bacteroidales bacterium]
MATKKENKAPEKPVDTTGFVLAKQNYIILLIGFLVIVTGFVLMAGGGTDDPAVFSDKIFSFRRITLAPILVIIGFAIEIFAIMKRPSERKDESGNAAK